MPPSSTKAFNERLPALPHSPATLVPVTINHTPIWWAFTNSAPHQHHPHQATIQQQRQHRKNTLLALLPQGLGTYQWSISHSESLTVLAYNPTSHHPIGVDIEGCKPVPKTGLKHYLTPQEMANLANPLANNTPLYLWTIKEACFKADPHQSYDLKAYTTNWQWDGHHGSATVSKGQHTWHTLSFQTADHIMTFSIATNT